MTVEELQVLITANTTELRKEINKANSSILGLQKGASKSGAGVLSAFKVLKTGIVALGIGKVIKDSIQSGMDAIESDSLFDTSLGKYADAVRSWSDEVSSVLGLNAVAMRKNTGVIYNMTSSMGVAEDSALTMSKGISLLSEDMASFYNLDSTEAFNKLRAGLTGETEPLKALGILVDENTVKQVAYSEGIAQNGAELTQQQKVLARYVAILKQTGNAQGDLARTIDSPSNQLRQFKQQVTQLGLAFSNFLMPIVSVVLPYLTAFTRVVTQASNGLAKFMGLSSTNASTETQKISDNVGGLNSGLSDANKNAKKLKSTLSGFDEMNVLQDNTSDSSISAGVGAVDGDMGFNLAEYDAHLDWVNSRTDEIAEKIKTVFAGVGESLKTVWGIAWDSAPVQSFVGAVTSYGQLLWDYWSTLGINLGLNIGATWQNISDNLGVTLTNMSNLWTMFWIDLNAGIETWGQPFVAGVSGVFNSIWTDAIDPVLQVITTGWATMSQTLKDLWDKYGKDLIDGLAGFVVSVISIVQSLWDNVIDPIITPMLNELKDAWNSGLGDCIKSTLDFVLKLVNLATTIWNEFIDPVVKWLLEFLMPYFSVVGNYIGDTVNTIIRFVSNVVGGVMDYLSALIDFWVSIFKGDLQGMWDAFKKGWTAIAKILIGLLGGIINPFIDTINNAFIGALNTIEFDIPDWVPVVGGKKFDFNIPKIPKLARGGIIDSPTYAMIGEAGKEAVMPLERNTGWIDQLADRIGDKLGGVAGNIQLIVKLGEDTIFDRFIDYQKAKSFETNGEVFAV